MKTKISIRISKCDWCGHTRICRRYNQDGFKVNVCRKCKKVWDDAEPNVPLRDFDFKGWNQGLRRYT